ncbi:MAG: hypothetical protein AAF458_04640 [Pseudomonadota bacterium]
MEQRPGILAIWNDRDDEIDGFYEQWYVHQHLLERVALPGWRFGRRYERLGDAATGPRFFTYYEMDSVDAMYSDAYLARLNDPTPETERVMRHWRNMTRTSCALWERRGDFTGACVVVARFDAAAQTRQLLALADAALRKGHRDGPFGEADVLATQVWVNETPRTPDSTESGMRGEPDRQIDAAVVLDCLRVGDAERNADWLATACREAGLTPLGLGAYAFLCEYRPPADR